MVCLTTALPAESPAASDASGVVYDLSRASHIEIDGKLADWEDKGLAIEQLALDCPNKAPRDHSAWAKLAWTREDLLVAVRVWDDVLQSLASPVAASDAPQGDSVQIVFNRAGEVFAADLLLPPLEGSEAPVFQCCAEMRPRAVAFSRVEGGYGLEVAFPWEGLGIEPRKNLQFGLRILVRDRDPGEACNCLSWRSLDCSAEGGSEAIPLRFSTRPSLVDGLCIWHEFDGEGRCLLTLQAPAHHEGDTVAVAAGESEGAKGVFAPLPGELIVEARVALPVSWDAAGRALLEISVGDEPHVHYRLNREPASR